MAQFAESWKSLGNASFKAGDYATAIAHYSKALEIDPKNAIYYTNRSLAYVSDPMAMDWELSLQDAVQAVKLDPKYVKGHYRLVKALLQLHHDKEARQALLYAFSQCGTEITEFNELENEVFERTGISIRPRATEFNVVSELGDGNFSVRSPL